MGKWADILEASLPAGEAGSSKAIIAAIKEAVSCRFHIEIADIIGPERARTVSLQRQVAFYLCHVLTNYTERMIGREFGDRDRKTVSQGIARVSECLKCDPEFAKIVEELRRQIAADTSFSEKVVPVRRVK